MGVGVEGRRVSVALGEGIRQHRFGLPRRLGEQLAYRFAVQLAELPGGQDLLQVEYLEEVEFKITHVALVVTHRCAFHRSDCARA